MIYLNLDKDGYLLSVSKTPTAGPAVKSLEGVDLSGYRIEAYRWDGDNLVLDDAKLNSIEAAEKEREQTESKPSDQEQLRADVDFLLVM